LAKKQPFNTAGLAEHNQRIIEAARRATLSSYGTQEDMREKIPIEGFESDLTIYVNGTKKPVRAEFMRVCPQYQTIAYQSGYREILDKLLPPMKANRYSNTVDMSYANVPVEVIESILPTITMTTEIKTEVKVDNAIAIATLESAITPLLKKKEDLEKDIDAIYRTIALLK